MEIPVFTTLAEVHRFFGTRQKATKMSTNLLQKLKQQAKEDYTELSTRQVQEIHPARRMHLNGAIAARTSIIDRVDQLLKAKGLGVNRPG